MAHQVFISYSSHDKAIADEIVQRLESEDLRCWIAPRDVAPGRDWNAAIIEALASCQLAILVWTVNSNSSPSVALEVKHAIKRNIPLIPFRTEDVAPSQALEFYLAFVQCQDAASPPTTNDLNKLLSHVQASLANGQNLYRTASEPSPPYNPKRTDGNKAHNSDANRKRFHSYRLRAVAIVATVTILLGVGLSAYLVATSDSRAKNVAMARLSSGHFVWVNGDGSFGGEMKSDDKMPAYFVRGFSEEGTAEALADNQLRLNVVRQLATDASVAAVKDRLSEVNLTDTRDVRFQLSGLDSQIEIRVGATNFGTRLVQALRALDQSKESGHGSQITYVDVQTDRAVLGFLENNKKSK